MPKEYPQAEAVTKRVRNFAKNIDVEKEDFTPFLSQQTIDGEKYTFVVSDRLYFRHSEILELYKGKFVIADTVVFIHIGEVTKGFWVYEGKVIRAEINKQLKKNLIHESFDSTHLICHLRMDIKKGHLYNANF